MLQLPWTACTAWLDSELLWACQSYLELYALHDLTLNRSHYTEICFICSLSRTDHNEQTQNIQKHTSSLRYEASLVHPLGFPRDVAGWCSFTWCKCGIFSLHNKTYVPLIPSEPRTNLSLSRCLEKEWPIQSGFSKQTLRNGCKQLGTFVYGFMTLNSQVKMGAQVVNTLEQLTCLVCYTL